jgi:hypothetical protein
MDFQEAFLALFWEPWAWGLGLFLAVVIVVSIYWTIARGFHYRTPQQESRQFAGQTGEEEGVIG